MFFSYSYFFQICILLSLVLYRYILMSYTREEGVGFPITFSVSADFGSSDNYVVLSNSTSSSSLAGGQSNLHIVLAYCFR